MCEEGVEVDKSFAVVVKFSEIAPASNAELTHDLKAKLFKSLALLIELFKSIGFRDSEQQIKDRFTEDVGD